MIFIISFTLAALIPDVPQSVKNEIQREKLLAYEAIHVRQELATSSSPQPPTGEGGGGEGGVGVEVVIEDA